MAQETDRRLRAQQVAPFRGDLVGRASAAPD